MLESEINDHFENGAGLNDEFKPCLKAYTPTDITLEHYADYLLGHPFYIISQRSHELFHSGMLAWMMKFNHRFIDVFFPNACLGNAKQQQIHIETEMDRRDITIMVDDKELYVIENKVKSFYGKDQLVKYQREIKSKVTDEADDEDLGLNADPFKSGVVLGVLDNNDSALPKDARWQYLSWREVLDGLCDKFESMKNDGGIDVQSFECVLIENYLQFLDAWLSITSRYWDNDIILQHRWEIDQSTLGVLRKCRLEAFVKQLLAVAFREYYLKMRLDSICDKDAWVEFDCPYNFGADQKIVLRVCSRREVRQEPAVSLSIEVVGNRIRTKGEYSSEYKKSTLLDAWEGERVIRGKDFESLAEEVHRLVDKAKETIRSVLKG